MVIAENSAFTMLSFWNLHDKHLFLCPMKRRRYIAWVLMLVSIIMLTASVLPHHHHREILCLQHDMTLCGCQCSVQHQQHNNSSDENHTCNAGCAQSRTVFDRSNVSLLGLVNLNNLFGTYTGTPRPFEIEAIAGIGWLHYYMNQGMGSDQNSMSTKLGMNFNFNLGESKAWTLALKPALAYDMNAMGSEPVCFHSKQAVWEISIGLKYHFGCSNGKHHFTKVRPYDQQEVNVLNEKINQLHSQIGKNAEALEEAVQKVTELEAALAKCQSQEPKIMKDTIDNSRKTLESVITFRQGKTTIDNSQLPNIERIATYLKNHKEASVVIKGYASPEGSAEVNERIAQQRAEIVKKMLMDRYGIAGKRIVAEGQGIGNMFEEPDWNRVSICTINVEKESHKH